MVAGAPFPDLYDWTWGELVEFVECRSEAEKQQYRMQARMDFKLAALMSRMIAGKSGRKIELMDEYDFLWSKEERQKAKVARMEQQLNASSVQKRHMTREEQSAYLKRMEKKMGV